MKRAGYKSDAIRNSLTKLGPLSGEEGQLVCTLQVLNGILMIDLAIKEQIRMHPSLLRPRLCINYGNGFHILRKWLPNPVISDRNQVVDKLNIGRCNSARADASRQLKYLVFREGQQVMIRLCFFGLLPNVHFPGIGLVIEKSGQSSSYSSALLPSTPVSPLASRMVMKMLTSSYVRSQKTSFNGVCDFFYWNRLKILTQGSHHCYVETKLFTCSNLREPLLKKRISVGLVTKCSATFYEAGTTNLVNNALPMEQSYKLPEVQKESDRYIYWKLKAISDSNPNYPPSNKRGPTDKQNECHNKSKNLQWAKGGPEVIDLVFASWYNRLILNYNTISSTCTTLRRSKVEKNQNCNCSVKISDFMSQYVIASVTPYIISPITPLALTLPTELPTEEPEQTMTNNANQRIDLPYIK